MFQFDNIQMVRNMLELSFERTFDGDADAIIDKFGRHTTASVKRRLISPKRSSNHMSVMLMVYKLHSQQQRKG